MLIMSFTKQELGDKYMKDARDQYIIDFGANIAVNWMLNISGLRFGQLMYNFSVWLKRKGIDIFYIEDEEFLTYFNEFTKEMKKAYVKWEN